MKPEDVPDELVRLACIGFWPGGRDQLEAAVFAYGGEMRAVLAAVLPARDAQIERETRAKVAEEARATAAAMQATGVNSAALGYFANKLDEPRAEGTDRYVCGCGEPKAPDARQCWDCAHPGIRVTELTDEQVRAYLDQHPEVLREFLHREVRRDPAWLREYLRKETRIAGRFPFERLD